MSVAVRVYKGRKKELYERIQRLAREHEVIGVSKLYKVKASLLGEVRRQLRGKAVVLGVKNKLALKALRELGLDGVERLEDYMSGQSALIFTNMNPFELYLTLERLKVEMPAAAGDVATSDVVIPSGNTGLQPGPILSSFKQFKIPTRIESGSIFVTQDTVVARAGDVISADLASLLSKLGLKPIRRGISLEAVYWRGRIIPAEELRVDPKKYEEDVREAHSEALALAIGVAYPIPEALPTVLARAHSEALALARGAGVLTSETAGDVLATAEAHARALAAVLSSKGFQLTDR